MQQEMFIITSNHSSSQCLDTKSIQDLIQAVIYVVSRWWWRHHYDFYAVYCSYNLNPCEQVWTTDNLQLCV